MNIQRTLLTEIIPSLLNGSACIVTTSEHLNKVLKEQVAKLQQENKQTVWSSPKIMTFSQWLGHWFHATLLTGQLEDSPHKRLSEIEENIIWESVISQQETDNYFLQIGPVANVAKQAWRLQHDWHLDIETQPQTEELARYIVWSQAFSKECQRLGRIDEARFFKKITQ